MGAAHVVIDELGEVGVRLCPPVAQDEASAVDVQHNLDAALVVRRRQRSRIPRRTYFNRLDIVVEAQRALVQVACSRLDAYEALFLSAGCERDRRLALDK